MVFVFVKNGKKKGEVYFVCWDDLFFVLKKFIFLEIVVKKLRSKSICCVWWKNI